MVTTYHNDKWSHKQVNLKSGYNVCYELKSLVLDNKTTLVLSNIRELDRVLNTK